MNAMSVTKLEKNKAKLEDVKISFKNTEHPYYPILDVTF